MEVKPSTTTIMSDDFSSSVWGDDAPQFWLELSKERFRRAGDSLLLASTPDVTAVLQDARTFSSGVAAQYLGSDTGLIPLQVDPPEHKRYRKFLDPLFAPRRMAVIESDVTAFANQLIDAFADRGECDFSQEFAVPFPTGTFLRLLGLPLSGLPEFLDLKERVIRPEAATLEEMNAIRIAAGAQIHGLFNSALDERAAKGTDDILGFLAQLETAGELDREQSLNICHLLLIAGLDTVTGALSTMWAALARQPELQRRLVDDPSIVPQATEELLRWSVTSPVQGRIATADIDLNGLAIKRGDKVRALNAIVNFDPAVMPDPLTIDLTRANNRHATFGLGVHRCLGSHLARLEIQVALREWHRRIPTYRLAPGTSPLYSLALREIRNLPVVFGD